MIHRMWIGWYKFMLKKWYSYMVYPRILPQVEAQDFKPDYERRYRRPLTENYSLVVPTTLRCTGKPKE